MKNSWYAIKAKSDAEYDVVIYDEIGFWGVSAKDFISEFKQIPGDAKINLRINSPGGEVFDGLAIYNLIRAHDGETVATIDGLAASMASAIALAADRVVMPENAFMMIHNPWGIAIGDADEMREMGEFLDKLNATLRNIYVKKSGQEPDKIRELMDAESWLTAAEARDLGLSDETTEPQKLAASSRWKAKFAKLPLPLDESPQPAESPPSDAGTVTAPSPQPASVGANNHSPLPHVSEDDIRAEAEKRVKDILDHCTRAGVPDAAASFLDKGLSADEVKAKLADADKIRARCAAARLPDRAAGYIKAGMSADEVTNDLWDVMLQRQGPEIDGKLGPQGVQGNSAIPPKINVKEIYAQRNSRK